MDRRVCAKPMLHFFEVSFQLLIQVGWSDVKALEA